MATRSALEALAAGPGDDVYSLDNDVPSSSRPATLEVPYRPNAPALPDEQQVASPETTPNTLRVETPAGRFYRNAYLNNALSPSVTNILSRTTAEAFTQWAVNQAIEFILKHKDEGHTKKYLRESAKDQPSKLRDYHAEIGTAVHKQLWTKLREDVDEEVSIPEIIKALSGWDKFLEDSGARLIADEQEVVGLVYPSDKLGYGGTYDSIIELPDKRRILIDIKSSRTIHIHHALQLAAYWQALPKGFRISEAWIVKVDKYAYDRYETYGINRAKAWKAFKSAHALYRDFTDEVWDE